MTAGGGDAPARPRVLVTGFSVFPGAPVNPTEALVSALNADRSLLPAGIDFRAEVLEVDYRTVPERLAALGADFAPDIAIHFGLAASATGFRLERLARNRLGSSPDVTGGLAPAAAIRPCAGDLMSGLPLAAIHAKLVARGLPSDWSDDAGDYLCNFTFYLACSPVFAAFSPAMAGFIHVPQTDTGILSTDDLVRGAVVIVETCVAAFRDVSRAPAISGGRAGP